MKKAIIFTILIISLALTGCALKKSVKVDENNQAKTQDNAVVSETANTSNWQTFNEEENGVKKGVLSNFKFPKDWFTYNFSGGTVVEIFFSDNEDEEEDNVCKLSITHHGSDDSYFVRKYNNKNDVNLKEACGSVLMMLEKQVPQH